MWEYRGVFGDTHLGTKEGIISHEVELGYTLEGLKPPKFMNQGPVKKEALRRYLQSYEEAGVVSRTSGEAYSNAFLVKKPGHIAKGQEEIESRGLCKRADEAQRERSESAASIGPGEAPTNRASLSSRAR